MPRLSTLCPRPGEKGTREDRHEALQLEMQEGSREARRVEPRGPEERVRVSRLVGVETRKEGRGVWRKMIGDRHRIAIRDGSPEPTAFLLGQLLEEVVGVPHENRAVLE